MSYKESDTGVRVYRRAAIRPCERSDEPVLIGLAALERGADERTLTVFEHETVFVAEVEGEPAGYVAVEHHEQAVRVDQLFVTEEHEDKEIGGQLLEYAEGYAISRDAKTLQVVVETENRLALDFYRGRGFVPVAEDLFELVLPRR